MAIALFRKDTTSPVTFFRVFATQSLVSEYGYTNTNIYKSVTITDAEFNDIRTNVRVPESVDSDDNITWQTDEDTPSWSKEAFEYNLKQTIAALKHVNENRNGHSQQTVFTNYINFLQSIDTSSITWPYAKDLEKHASDAGETFIHVSEIP